MGDFASNTGGEGKDRSLLSDIALFLKLFFRIDTSKVEGGKSGQGFLLTIREKLSADTSHNRYSDTERHCNGL